MSNNNLGSYPSDANLHPEGMNCVYAISGTYGLLPRTLYYLTLAFAIFGRHREWLIIGALVTAMTYAGTTAIHQMALVSSKTDIYDLDILGSWAILSSGALAYISFMHWSSALRDSHVRMIFLIWGFLLGVSAAFSGGVPAGVMNSGPCTAVLSIRASSVDPRVNQNTLLAVLHMFPCASVPVLNQVNTSLQVALIFGRSEIFSTPLTDPEPACYSSNGQLLMYPIELVSPTFNCTYECFSKTKAMRQASEVMAVPHSTLKNKYTDLSVVLVGPIQFAAYAALSWGAMEHSPSRICTWIVMTHLEPKHRERWVNAIHDASMERRYGGYFALWHFTKRKQWGWLKATLILLVLPWYILGLIIDILALPLLVINIVLNELALLKPDLPTNEANYAIGQWGAWVNVALVLLAALINQYTLWSRRRKERAKAAKAAEKQEQPLSVFEVQDLVEEQTMIGVVKPGLAHVPTLQDLGSSRTKGKQPQR